MASHTDNETRYASHRTISILSALAMAITLLATHNALLAIVLAIYGLIVVRVTDN